jgi:hypothetical protein
MKSNFLLLTIALLSLFFTAVKGQTEPASTEKYTLLTMPYNQRPILLYKGQFQTNAGYKLAVRTKSFDENGEAIILKEQGNSSVLHCYYAELKYGVTDFMEISAETNYQKKGVRSESVTYINGFDVIETNELNEFKGMSDVNLFLSFRLPIDYRRFDFAIRGGISIPSAQYEPDIPTHSITNITSANNYTINYHYNNRNGTGVPVYSVSAITKFSFSKFAVEADLTFCDPVKEGSSIRWDETLTDLAFSYASKPYQYLPDRTISVNASIHYQPVGWFNLYVNNNYFKTSEGWTEYNGSKYANKEIELFSLEPGFEIQISPFILIYQTAGFPLWGKSTDAPFYLLTTLKFNMFPFAK